MRINKILFEAIQKSDKVRSIFDKFQRQCAITEDDFDNIVTSDATSRINNQNSTIEDVGYISKQLLLLAFANGERDFLSQLEDLKTATNTLKQNPGQYPKINQYASVKNFIAVINTGEDLQQAEQEDLITKIYKKYYSQRLTRELFDQIIQLDPKLPKIELENLQDFY